MIFDFHTKCRVGFELHNGQLPLCPCLGALPDPPKPVSSIQVAPSDIFWVFWEWTKLVLDIGNFLARTTIWFLTLERINSKHFEITYLTKRLKRLVQLQLDLNPTRTPEHLWSNFSSFLLTLKFKLFLICIIIISLLVAASWRRAKTAGSGWALCDVTRYQVKSSWSRKKMHFCQTV